jgi:hypothetical protein
MSEKRFEMQGRKVRQKILAFLACFAVQNAQMYTLDQQFASGPVDVVSWVNWRFP